MTKQSFVLAALAAIAAAQVRPLNKVMNNPHFLNWMSQHNHNYDSTLEMNLRAQIYNDNDEKIKSLNASSAASGKSNAAVYGHNDFSDLTESEFQHHLGLQEKNPADRVKSLNRRTGSGRNQRVGDDESRGRGGRTLVADATHVDHVKDGHMYPVKQQGGCGSCWAFAANSALEGYVAQKEGKAPQRLSEQHLVDCTLTNNDFNKDLFGKTYGLWGCNGGWMSYAWWFQKEQGVMTDADYPYTSGRTGKETQCAHKADNTIGKVTQWGQIKDSIDDVKEKLKTHPMTIAIDAGKGVFQFYKSGVIAADAGCGNSLNHAVVIVGYTDKGGDDPTPNPDPQPEPQPDPQPDPVNEECTVYKWWHTCKGGNNTRRLQDVNGYENYWKIQNSWGTNWGDNGFVLFEIAEGEGVCGMNSYIEWVEM